MNPFGQPLTTWPKPRPTHRFFVLLLLIVVQPGFGQQPITWETLSDVHFSDRYSKSVDAYYYYPHFGPTVKALEGQEVSLKGYMLVIDPKEDIYILSRNPFSSCFFCGNGGPESIVELKLVPGHPRFKSDQVVTIKGILKLNQNDLYQCSYIFEKAGIDE